MDFAPQESSQVKRNKRPRSHRPTHSWRLLDQDGGAFVPRAKFHPVSPGMGFCASPMLASICVRFLVESGPEEGKHGYRRGGGQRGFGRRVQRIDETTT